MNICFIGFGHMAKAIAKGLINHKTYTLYATAPSLAEGQNKDGIHTHHDNRVVAALADVVILAIKPQKMPEVLMEISPVLKKNSLLLSVAAGIHLDWLASHSPDKQAIIRSMPNTPASIGEGATPLIANQHCKQSQKDCADAIFSSVGIVTWLTQEDQLDTYTALSGSGPAYVFKFMESMIDAAKTLGLNADDAKLFTLQTVKGALGLALKTDSPLSELRKKVTSPNGTTEAALNILCHGELDELILAAMQAARLRAIELGKML